MADDLLTTLRLTSRTKHFAQLVARNSGMSFGELVEHLLEDFLQHATVDEGGEQRLVSELMIELWADEKADRIALLGNRFPDMLTERERVIWQRIVCETAWYWKVELSVEPIPVITSTFHFERFRSRLETYEGLSRDEIIVMANALSKQRKNASKWPTNKSKAKGQ